MTAPPGAPEARPTAPDAGTGTDAPTSPKLTVGSVLVVIACLAPIVLFLEFTRGPYRSIAIVLWLTMFPLLFSARTTWRGLRSGNYRGLPRFSEKEAKSFVNWQWTWVIFLWLLWLRSDWTFETVGLRPEVAAPVGFLAGFALYLPVHLLARAWGRWRSGEEKARRDWLRAMRRFFPRSARGRHLVWRGIVFVPFVEEIAHRGILVVLFARESGHLVPVIGLGLLVAIAVHAYQGATQILIHLCFAGLAIALALSPFGLWGAIGLHVAGDLVPMLRFPRVFAALRAARAARGRT